MLSPIKHFIIADDDADDRYLFQNAITEMDQKITLTLAKNCDELMKFLEEFPTPDAIILDINMQPKSGKVCLKDIRSREEFDKIPVVMLTTSKNKSDVSECLALGANDYFVKPVTYQELQTLITSLSEM